MRDLLLREVVVLMLGERRPPPQTERLAQVGCRLLRLTSLLRQPPALQQLLEPAGIDRLGIDLQRIAGGVMVHGHSLAEPVAKSGDVLLQRLQRAGRLIPAPESLEQGIRGDGLRRVHGEHDEQRALLDTVEPNGRTRNLDLERPEHLDGDFPAHSLVPPSSDGQSIVTLAASERGPRAREDAVTHCHPRAANEGVRNERPSPEHSSRPRWAVRRRSRVGGAPPRSTTERSATSATARATTSRRSS